MHEYLQIRSDKLISSNSLRDLASIILKNNHFENEELRYHQKWGFAIGTKFTSPYSNLYMAGLEKRKLARCKLKEFIYKDAGTSIWGHSNCDICKILENGDQFESTVTRKKYCINFPFERNSCYIVYLLTC